MAQVNKTIERWAATAIDDRTRKNTLAPELARLDELQGGRRAMWRDY